MTTWGLFMTSIRKIFIIWHRAEQNAVKLSGFKLTANFILLIIPPPNLNQNLNQISVIILLILLPSRRVNYQAAMLVKNHMRAIRVWGKRGRARISPLEVVIMNKEGSKHLLTIRPFLLFRSAARAGIPAKHFLQDRLQMKYLSPVQAMTCLETIFRLLSFNRTWASLLHHAETPSAMYVGPSRNAEPIRQPSLSITLLLPPSQLKKNLQHLIIKGLSARWIQWVRFQRKLSFALRPGQSRPRLVWPTTLHITHTTLTARSYRTSKSSWGSTWTSFDFFLNCGWGIWAERG